MCVSLGASLVAGAGLALVGYGVMRKALRNDRSMVLFAAFPLIFSAHQFIEAGSWATLHDPLAGQIFRYLYTLIAFALWPAFTPFAAAFAEEDPERRRTFFAFGRLGLLLSFYLIDKLIGADGIDLYVENHSLHYDPLFERPPLFADALYLFLTVTPLLLCGRRGVAWFGWAVLASFVFALSENRPAWYSLWCFGAALFSCLIAMAIREEGGAGAGRLQMQH